MFSTHALSYANYGYFRIKKNDDVICATWIPDESGDVSACSTVTHLDLGDEVKVTGDDIWILQEYIVTELVSAVSSSTAD